MLDCQSNRRSFERVRSISPKNANKEGQSMTERRRPNLTNFQTRTLTGKAEVRSFPVSLAKQCPELEINMSDFVVQTPCATSI